MKNLEEIANDKPITEELTYDSIIEKLNEAKENGTPIDEGIFGAIGGAICKALGVDPKGSFGSLLTSRLVMGAICTTMGWKM